MKIGIDIRSLMEPKYSGVSEYAFNLLNAIFDMDKKNEYSLFYNNFSNSYQKGKFFQENRALDNVKYSRFKIPNRLFNAGLAVFNYPKIDRMLGDVDVFFSPNFLFFAFSKRCKTILTVHDLSFERCPEFYTLRGKLWHKIINTKKLCKRADCIIAVSENTKNDLMELYKIEESKIKVIYSGLGRGFKNSCDPITLARVREKYQIPQIFILHLGNIETRKNIIGIIKAFERLHFQYKINDYSLIFAGAASYGYGGKKIFEIAKRSKLREKIKFLGYVENGDKAALYQMAKIFIYPSFYEGFGFPPLEAMACGAPTITSNVSSLPEIVGDAAVMVDPYNIEDMSKAMAQILSDADLRNFLIKQGEKRANNFNWEKCARETLQIIEDL